MGKRISEINWATIKHHINIYRFWKMSDLVDLVGVSETTIRRVKKSKDYNHYKQILIEDRGKKWQNTTTTRKNKSWARTLLKMLRIRS